MIASTGLIEALVDSAADREESVRGSIFKSIVDIGRKKHAQVLDVMHSYLSKHNKVSLYACILCTWIIIDTTTCTQLQLARPHRIILLKLMEKVCKGHIESVPEEQAAKLIALGSSELTMSSEVVPEWQGAASQLLSTLGIRYAQLVMKELLIKFQPGGNPHYFVVYTLGLLATSNGTATIL